MGGGNDNLYKYNTKLFYGSVLDAQELVNIQGSGNIESFYIAPVLNTEITIEVDGERCFSISRGRGTPTGYPEFVIKPITMLNFDIPTNITKNIMMVYINEKGQLAKYYDTITNFGYFNIEFGKTRFDFDLDPLAYYTFYDITFKKSLKITNSNHSCNYSFLVNYMPI